ncbi:hypothetical protein [Methylobacterium tarhaniae]|uniref:hypothetical protein n=1 Tax=Methylobacterium tarhaniae TaxID=1187852 RepID=UPI000653A0E8|nr:hypothetical protein [Methylobacterium tarhaniae]
MWHTAIGYWAVAATSAIVIRHFGAPRVMIIVFVLSGIAASVATGFQAGAGLVGSRIPAIAAGQEPSRPAFYRSTRECGPWQ